jgi:L-ascorbate metabolism protein UlaG (beta-lactamase superfamily)
VHAKRKLFGSLVGNGNGYLLKVTNNYFKYTVYVTGDSVYNKSSAEIFTEKNIDLIIANAGSAMVGRPPLSAIIGRITNNIPDIKKMLSDLNPGTLIPVHWGTFSHYTERIKDSDFKEYRNVRVLKPGDSIQLK